MSKNVCCNVSNKLYESDRSGSVTVVVITSADMMTLLTRWNAQLMLTTLSCPCLVSSWAIIVQLYSRIPMYKCTPLHDSVHSKIFSCEETLTLLTSHTIFVIFVITSEIVLWKCRNVMNRTLKQLSLWCPQQIYFDSFQSWHGR